MSPDFGRRVAAALAEPERMHFIRDATASVHNRRVAAWSELPDPDALRTLAAQIKDHTLEHLDEYLDQFIEKFTALGGKVHLAGTGEEAVELVRTIATEADCRVVSKSKSMVSEEVDLNTALQEAGLEVVETDLGEFIVQLDRDHPSHIVLPIIHKDISTIASVMQRHLGGEYTEDEKKLTRAAREHLRPLFRRCDLGVSGVNFAVAETGSIVIVTNEGNGRFTTTRPRVHVAVMGIEKLVPRLEDVTVMVKLLGRSGTGQALTVYTNFITGPKRSADPDGPDEVHVVILDRGRSGILGSKFREALRCIRCGSCLNACPVYRSIGGHAYGAVYPGPIGKVITPLLDGLEKFPDLPQASSLCGGCLEACPVKIDIPRMLVDLRGEAIRRGLDDRSKRYGMRFLLWTLRFPWLYRFGQRVICWFLSPRRSGGWIRSGVGPIGGWTKARRDFKRPAETPFRELWRKELCDGGVEE